MGLAKGPRGPDNRLRPERNLIDLSLRPDRTWATFRRTRQIRRRTDTEGALFKKIDHIEIVTHEPERSVAFYTGVLGFKVSLRQQLPLPGGASLGIVYLDLFGTGIELLTYTGMPVEAAPQKPQLGYRMMALEVEDMDRAFQHLKTAGIEPSWGPVRTDHYTRAEIRYPDGNPIELRQWHRPRA